MSWFQTFTIQAAIRRVLSNHHTGEQRGGFSVVTCLFGGLSMFIRVNSMNLCLCIFMDLFIAYVTGRIQSALTRRVIR